MKNEVTMAKSSKSPLENGMTYCKVAKSVYKAYSFAAQNIDWLPGISLFDSGPSAESKQISQLLEYVDDLKKTMESRFDQISATLGDLLDNTYSQTQIDFYKSYNPLKEAYGAINVILTSTQYESIREDDTFMIDVETSDYEWIQKQVDAIRSAAKLDEKNKDTDDATLTLKRYFSESADQSVLKEFSSYLDLATQQFDVLSKALDAKYPEKQGNTLSNVPQLWNVHAAMRSNSLYDLYLQYELTLTLLLNYDIVRNAAGFDTGKYRDMKDIITGFNEALMKLTGLYTKHVGTGIPYLLTFCKTPSNDDFPDEITFVTMKHNDSIESLSNEEVEAVKNADQNTSVLKSAMNKLWGDDEWCPLQRVMSSAMYQREVKSFNSDYRNFRLKVTGNFDYNHGLLAGNNIGYDFFNHILFQSSINTEKNIDTHE